MDETVPTWWFLAAVLVGGIFAVGFAGLRDQIAQLRTTIAILQETLREIVRRV